MKERQLATHILCVIMSDQAN